MRLRHRRWQHRDGDRPERQGLACQTAHPSAARSAGRVPVRGVGGDLHRRRCGNREQVASAQRTGWKIVRPCASAGVRGGQLCRRVGAVAPRRRVQTTCGRMRARSWRASRASWVRAHACGAQRGHARVGATPRRVCRVHRVVALCFRVHVLFDASRRPRSQVRDVCFAELRLDRSCRRAWRGDGGQGCQAPADGWRPQGCLVGHGDHEQEGEVHQVLVQRQGRARLAQLARVVSFRGVRLPVEHVDGVSDCAECRRRLRRQPARHAHGGHLGVGDLQRGHRPRRVDDATGMSVQRGWASPRGRRLLRGGAAKPSGR